MSKQANGYGTSGQPFKAWGESHVRWIEKPARDYGLRFIGYADEICRRNYSFAYGIDHKGWFLEDEYGGEVARGCVLQMSGKNGQPRFIPAVADPFNDGCYIASFDEIFIGERRSEDEGASYDRAARECARRADQIAERYAEQERDYRRAWQAGNEHRELGEQVKAARQACLALIRETRAACQSLASYGSIRETIRARIIAYRNEIQRAYDRRAELVSDYGTEAGFKDA